MNIEDFKKDITELVKIYNNVRDTEYLELWLKARKYSDDEIQFLRRLLQDLYQEEYIKAYEAGTDGIQATRPIGDVLLDITAKSPYPESFNNLDGTYIRLKEPFNRCEIWAFTLGYIGQNGKWNATKGLLGGFLKLLSQRAIISQAPGVAEYFAGRYGTGDISEQLKSGKAKPHVEKLMNEGIEGAINNFPPNS